jgi:hypothetical protein
MLRIRELRKELMETGQAHRETLLIKIMEVKTE